MFQNWRRKNGNLSQIAMLIASALIGLMSSLSGEAQATLLADQSLYCETGDPSGRGPTAEVQFKANSKAKIDLDLIVRYSQKDVLLGKTNSREFAYHGPALSARSVEEQGLTCVAHSAKGPNSRREVELFVCNEGEIVFLRLLHFSKTTDQLDLSCN